MISGFVLVLFLAPAGGAAPGLAEPALREILADHAARYPEWEIQDLYKLIFQGAMGSEHAVPDPEGARKVLERELATMGEGPAEPMIDPLSADRRLVRIHLRPFLAAGGDPEELRAAFVSTAREHRGSIPRLQESWEVAVRMAEQERLPFEPAALRLFIAEMKERQFPAVHHSATYRELYKPAYRVLLRPPESE